MGGCVSSNSSSTISNIIRVVHLDGRMEDYDFPVSVSQVTGSSKYFVLTAPQLLSTAFKPLERDTPLERGLLYFVVPFSRFQAAVYPSDFASIVKKLTAKAKSIKLSKVCPELISPATSPNGFLDVNDGRRCSRKKSWLEANAGLRERS